MYKKIKLMWIRSLSYKIDDSIVKLYNDCINVMENNIKKDLGEFSEIDRMVLNKYLIEKAKPYQDLLKINRVIGEYIYWYNTKYNKLLRYRTYYYSMGSVREICNLLEYRYSKRKLLLVLFSRYGLLGSNLCFAKDIKASDVNFKFHYVNIHTSDKVIKVPIDRYLSNKIKEVTKIYNLDKDSYLFANLDNKGKDENKVVMYQLYKSLDLIRNDFFKYGNGVDFKFRDIKSFHNSRMVDLLLAKNMGSDICASDVVDMFQLLPLKYSSKKLKEDSKNIVLFCEFMDSLGYGFFSNKNLTISEGNEICKMIEKDYDKGFIEYIKDTKKIMSNSVHNKQVCS